MTPSALRFRIENGQPGEVIMYHRGNLAEDVEGDFEAAGARAIAQEAATKGLVCLTQKRVKKDTCEYLMTICEGREFNWLRSTWPEIPAPGWDDRDTE